MYLKNKSRGQSDPLWAQICSPWLRYQNHGVVYAGRSDLTTNRPVCHLIRHICVILNYVFWSYLLGELGKWKRTENLPSMPNWPKFRFSAESEVCDSMSRNRFVLVTLITPSNSFSCDFVFLSGILLVIWIHLGLVYSLSCVLMVFSYASTGRWCNHISICVLLSPVIATA